MVRRELRRQLCGWQSAKEIDDSLKAVCGCLAAEAADICRVRG